MAEAPNMIEIVREVAANVPVSFRRCNRPDVPFPDNTYFPALVVRELHRLGSQQNDPRLLRFGLNGKRGNPNDPSKDAISWVRTESGLLVDVVVIDIVNSSGTLNDDGTRTANAIANGEAASSPAWREYTAIESGPGIWVNPNVVLSAVSGMPTNPPPSAPPVDLQLDAAYHTLRWFVDLFDAVAGLPPAQRPPYTRDEIIDALHGVRNACDRLLSARHS